MNLLLGCVLFLIIGSSVVLSQNNGIAEDNFNIQLDKTAHLATSFGLYFMFYTLYSDSLLFTLSDSIPIPLHSMISATAVGFTYEVYQSTTLSRSDGFSIHDMVYNVVGIGFARFTHEIFLYFKEIL